MPDPHEYEHSVATAVMKAIFDASLTEIDGKPTAYVATAEVMDALINVTASIMEGAPTCRTPKGIRDMADAVARKLAVRTREVRELIEETGKRSFDAITIRPS